MACGSCAQRRQLIGQAVTAVRNGQTIRPIAKAFGQSIVADVRKLSRPINPRLGKR